MRQLSRLPTDLLMYIAQIALRERASALDAEWRDKSTWCYEEIAYNASLPAYVEDDMVVDVKCSYPSYRVAMIKHVNPAFRVPVEIMRMVDTSHAPTRDAVVLWLFDVAEKDLLTAYSHVSTALLLKDAKDATAVELREAAASIAFEVAIRWFPPAVVDACFALQSKREQAQTAPLFDRRASGASSSSFRNSVLLSEKAMVSSLAAALRRGCALVMRSVLRHFCIDARKSHLVLSEEEDMLATLDIAVAKKRTSAVLELISVFKMRREEREGDATCVDLEIERIARVKDSRARAYARFVATGNIAEITHTNDDEHEHDTPSNKRGLGNILLRLATMARLHENATVSAFLERDFNVTGDRVLLFAQSSIRGWTQDGREFAKNHDLVQDCIAAFPREATETVISGMLVDGSLDLPHVYAKKALHAGAIDADAYVRSFARAVNVVMNKNYFSQQRVLLDVLYDGLPVPGIASHSGAMSPAGKAHALCLAVSGFEGASAVKLVRRVLEAVENDDGEGVHAQFRAELDLLCSAQTRSGLMGFAAYKDNTAAMSLLLNVWPQKPYLDDVSRYTGTAGLLFHTTRGSISLVGEALLRGWLKSRKEDLACISGTGGSSHGNIGNKSNSSGVSRRSKRSRKDVDPLDDEGWTRAWSYLPCLLEPCNVLIRGAPLSHYRQHDDPGDVRAEGVPALLLLALEDRLSSRVVSTKTVVDLCAPYLKANGSDQNPFPFAVSTLDSTKNHEVLRAVLSRRDVPVHRLHVHKSDGSTDTLLTWLFRRRASEAVRLDALCLLMRCPRLDAMARTMPHGNTAFHYMSAPDLYALLNNGGAGRRLKASSFIDRAQVLDTQNARGRTVFCEAIARLSDSADLDFVCRLIDVGPHLDQEDEEGTTPLLAACEKGLFLVAMALLSKDALYGSGNPAIAGRRTTSRQTAKYTVNVNAMNRRTGSTPLIAAIKHILDLHLRVMERGMVYWFISHDQGLFARKMNFVRTLLSHPLMASVNARDIDTGLTALGHVQEHVRVHPCFAYGAELMSRLADLLRARGAT